MALKKLAPLALALLSLTACASNTTPLSPSEQTRLEIERTFGGVDKRSLRSVYAGKGQDGRGFTIIRRYSEAPDANRFGPLVPDSFDQALVLDLGIEMMTVSEFPVYRLALRPRKLSEASVADWPGHVVLRRTGPDGQERQLAARLPDDRVLDAEGFLWTEWTYCSDCFNLRGIDNAGPAQLDFAFSLLDEARAAAVAPNGAPSPYAGMTLFLGLPGVGILQGEEAIEMAPVASELVRDARGRAVASAPALAAYRDSVRAFENTITPKQALLSECGAYAPIGRDAASPAETIAAETRHFEQWEACADAAIAAFDASARRSVIDAFAAAEGRLARDAKLGSTDRRMAMTLEWEMEEARIIGRKAHDAFQARIAELESYGRTAGALRLERGLGGEVLVKPSEFELGGDVDEGLPDAAKDDAALEPVAGPPLSAELFVTRLMRDGANLKLGQGSSSCAFDLDCEVGKVVPLIEVKSYCDTPGGMTRTAAGWGLVVQKYRPETRDEEIRLGEEIPGIAAVADTDQAALDAGIAAMEMERLDTGDRRFFGTFMDFYPVSHDEKGCSDDWRDAARHKVVNNL